MANRPDPEPPPRAVRRMRLNVTLAVIAAAAGVFAARQVNAEEVSGRAVVIDGDTLRFGRETIRLQHIDAPETAQRCQDTRGRSWACGRSAKARLTALGSRGRIICRGDQRDDYGRLLAVCSTPAGEINPQLVREGLAWAFIRYSTAYVDLEGEARRTKRGVFAAENTPPWDFRSGKWQAAEAPAGECKIKGNVSAKGARIYHMSWQRDYARTWIDPRKGERWFCDERGGAGGMAEGGTIGTAEATKRLSPPEGEVACFREAS